MLNISGLHKISWILKEFEPDQRDGSVSNIDTWVEDKCNYNFIPEHKENISNIIKKYFTSKSSISEATRDIDEFLKKADADSADLLKRLIE